MYDGYTFEKEAHADNCLCIICAEQREEWKALGIVVGYVPPEPEFVDAWSWPDNWPVVLGEDLGEGPTELRSLYGYG